VDAAKKFDAGERVGGGCKTLIATLIAPDKVAAK
jgi:hypothetical protein